MKSSVALIVVGLLSAAILYSWWRWKSRAASIQPSVYDQLQMNQRCVWQGRPVTVMFDYEPYLKEPSRRKVNVHTVQESANGERSFVGYCHDTNEDRAFRVQSVRGEVLIAKSGASMPKDAWLDSLIAGALND